MEPTNKTPPAVTIAPASAGLSCMLLCFRKAFRRARDPFPSEVAAGAVTIRRRGGKFGCSQTIGGYRW